MTPTNTKTSNDMPNVSTSPVVHPLLPHTTTPALTEYSSDNHNYKADDQVQFSDENADQESNSSHTVNIVGSSLLPQGQQTSSGENATSTDDPVEVDDQFSQQPCSPPADIHANFKNEVKVAILLITISSDVIAAALATIHGNEKAVHTRHKVMFKMFISLNYISLLSGICLFLLTQIMRPDNPSLVTIVRFTMWISLVALTCALGSATCLIYTFEEVGGGNSYLGCSPCNIDFSSKASRLSLFS